jgi:hypothetical protein
MLFTVLTLTFSNIAHVESEKLAEKNRNQNIMQSARSRYAEVKYIVYDTIYVICIANYSFSGETRDQKYEEEEESKV